MSDKKIEIYIAVHKKANVLRREGYIPLHVGAEGKEDLGFVKDNTGDNISCKNPNYCELTGLYWIWKNCNADIVGLVHYRRYFVKSFFTTNIEKAITKKDIIKYLQKYDVILPKPYWTYKKTVEEQYSAEHNIEDYKKLRNILEKNTPEYLDAFDKISKRRYFYNFNMFIMDKKLFNEYAKWVFFILEELEKQVDISNYNDYNKRIYGFLSERLFNVWIEKHQELKIKTLYANNVERKPWVDNVRNLKSKLLTKVFYH